MLKKDRQRRQLNNNGMTLVEVIITVTLLAVVSGFILSAFLSSMRMATKSRDLHRATTVAQNIMEGINLKTAEEMAFEFNYPYLLTDAGAKVDNFNVYPSTMFQFEPQYSVGELTQWTDPVSGDTSLNIVGTERTLNAYKALCLDKVTNAYDIACTRSAYLSDRTTKNFDFLEDLDGKYIYYMRNIRNDGRYYNAKITLNAAPYRSSGASGISVNSDELISVPTIDSTYDAVEIMRRNLDTEAIQELQIANQGADVSLDNLHRIITVDIENALMAMGEGQYRTKVKVSYEYYFTKPDSTNSDLLPPIPTNTVFDNEGDEDIKQLRNIYLYYYPMYKSGSNTDSIVINNNTNMDVDVFIIKQEKEDSALNQHQLMTDEQSYKVTLNVKETTDNLEGKSHIKLHTNLNENLAGIYWATALPAVNQVEYRRNSAIVTEDMFYRSDIKNKKAHDRMYDVTVEIYKSDIYDDVDAFTSETDVSKWFKTENYITTMTSSISQ